jgi:hypothetical protein
MFNIFIKDGNFDGEEKYQASTTAYPSNETLKSIMDSFPRFPDSKKENLYAAVIDANDPEGGFNYFYYKDFEKDLPPITNLAENIGKSKDLFIKAIEIFEMSDKKPIDSDGLGKSTKIYSKISKKIDKFNKEFYKLQQEIWSESGNHKF